MRFYTTHLMGLVLVVALILGVVRHPETLWAAAVPLAAGVFVVLPVLGTAELFMPRSSARDELSWRGAIAATVVGLIGSVIALAALVAIIGSFD